MNQEIQTPNSANQSITVPPGIATQPFSLLIKQRIWLRWVFVLLLVLLPAIILLGVEMGLRFYSFGYSVTYFIPSKIQNRDVYIENFHFGSRFFPSAATPLPRPTVMSAVKSEKTYRIFILGESAAMGYPNPAFSFSRFLEMLLQNRYPGIRFELINTAMDAINSHAILPIARECSRMQGDAFIIYTGNNEVIGPFGAGSVFTAFSPNLYLIRLGLSIKATRIGQGLEQWFHPLFFSTESPQTWRGMEMLMSEQHVVWEDQRLFRVYRHFQTNLEDIVEACSRSGPTLLCTVASNLRDCPPFSSRNRINIRDCEFVVWDGFFKAGKELEAAGKWDEALESYRKAADVDDQFAEIQFCLARTYDRKNQTEAARNHYIQARDLDTLRFRADSRINKIIRSVVNQKKSQNVRLVDVEKVFAENSPLNIPGENYFYDHIDLNCSGNYLLAKSCLESLTPMLPKWVQKTAGDSAVILTEEECLRHLAYTDWDRFKCLYTVVSRISHPPFTEQLDHPMRLEQRQDELQRVNNRLGKNFFSKILPIYRNVLASRPEDWILHNDYADALLASGNPQEASTEFRWIADHFPYRPESFYNLGVVAARLHQWDEAIRNYQHALQIHPESENARLNLAVTYEKKGMKGEALKTYEDLLKRNPSYPDAHFNLAVLYGKEKMWEQAAHHYNEVVRIHPQDGDAYSGLGKALMEQNQYSEAVAAFQCGLKIKPNDPTLMRNLAAAQAKLGTATESALN